MQLLSLLALLLLLGAAATLFLMLASAPFAWMSIAFMGYCRPRFVFLRATIAFFAIWILLTLLLPAGDGAIIGMLVAPFLAPWPAWLWVSVAAFRKDDPGQRRAASEIRNLKLEREGLRRRVSPDKRWREYVLDVERAKRAASYQLPTSRPPA